MIQLSICGNHVALPITYKRNSKLKQLAYMTNILNIVDNIHRGLQYGLCSFKVDMQNGPSYCRSCKPIA